MRKTVLGLIAFSLLCGGCQWRKVIDNETNKTYITRSDKWKFNDKNNTVKFYDFKSKRTVVMQEYEMEDITKDEAMEALGMTETPATPATK